MTHYICDGRFRIVEINTDIQLVDNITNEVILYHFDPVEFERMVLQHLKKEGLMK